MKKMYSVKSVVVLGATGVLGRALVEAFRQQGRVVSGTSRNRVGENLLLDTTNVASVKRFPWKKFGSVIDCTGAIEYGMTAAAASRTAELNIAAPMRIVAQLTSDQKYFYCSTHVALLSGGKQNTYSFSKKVAEQYFQMIDDGPRVSVLRIPGLFSEHRQAGLLYKIKRHYEERKPLALDLHTERWHIMYAPRAARLIANLVSQNTSASILTVGYPLETSLTRILRVAEQSFGYKLPIKLKTNRTDHYRPRPHKTVCAKPIDFDEDLHEFFHKK